MLLRGTFRQYRHGNQPVCNVVMFPRFPGSLPPRAFVLPVSQGEEEQRYEMEHFVGSHRRELFGRQ